MASLLIHIKSKTLLPRDPSDVLGGDAEDPRRELVERLLEHERFKAAAQMLMQKQQIEEATWSNPGMREFKDDAGAEREIAADTVDLVRVFQDILSRIRTRPVLDVDEESVTVAQMIDYVKRRLIMEDKPVSLRRMLHNTHTERALICMFLAMLELVRLQAVLLHQPALLGDILIKKTEAFDQVFADQAQARDDWR
jgi:segregation and condensation protein A